ncbi:hypothetical protein HYP71_gp091 [Arthrobacter phage KBurrousTX]|uniref:Uncharacterized protein n=1 Tax=Arthrobacter phage KBurrousTX TaxID=2315608 RepID=A0A386K8N1_9CAUD|nr:hypothetical protein HYP71_gp091 [Arthrobacter phage KBurrousTX]AYD81585.1 hypothetical protein KBurrousTX_91 [Arthrobacter phage KBurrousTX]
MSKPLVQYAEFTNGNRALAIDAKAPNGVRIKIKSTKSGSALGVFQVPHADLPAVMFELTGGHPTDKEVDDAREIVDGFIDETNTPQNVAALTRRLLLALHINNQAVAAATAAGAPMDHDATGCMGCAITEEAPEVLQDPDYDPTATELDGLIDPNEVPDTDPNIVAALARENAHLRQKLAAIEALTNPEVTL